MKSDTLLFVIILLVIIVFSGIIIWNSNKPNAEALLQDDVITPYSNVTNETREVASSFLKFKDIDNGNVIKAEFKVYNTSKVVVDENNTLFLRDSLVWSGSSVNYNYEVFNESEINMTYEVIGWNSFNNFSNYYGDNITCLITKDEGECSLFLKKKGKVYVNNVSGNDGVLLNVTPEFWVRKPTFLVGYAGVLNPRIEGLKACKIPKEFVLDFDKCFFYDGYWNDYQELVLRYDFFVKPNSLRVLFFDVDLVGEEETFFVDDVPNVLLEINITG